LDAADEGHIVTMQTNRPAGGPYCVAAFLSSEAPQELERLASIDVMVRLNAFSAPLGAEAHDPSCRFDWLGRHVLADL
jgi:hypothetical protein